MRAKYNKDGPSTEDKALDLFASMMIEKIQSLTGKDGWRKPWFTDGALSWPKNLSGREYNGMNAMMLLMLCEKNGYKIPRFCTFDCVQRLNGKDGGNEQREEEKLRVSILKGEKSFPVMLTTFTCIHKETKEKIHFDDYKRLSDEEKERYNVYPKMQVFRVFNVEQTNLREARPELWAKLEQECAPQEAKEQGERFSFEPVDTMIENDLWICPIRPTRQDNAYYSLSRDEIVVPEKEQFKDGESFYGTLFHEMTHSTGKKDALDRIKPSAFGSDEYAREELVAELGSALVAQRYGMSKHLKEDSASYLKSWLDSLRESPQFIKTTLVDVKKATSMITQRVDRIAEDLKKGVSEAAKIEKPVFYTSVAYLQMADDTQLFDRLQENGDYGRILQEAAEYDSGDSVDLEHVSKTARQFAGDDVLCENDSYAMVYNNSVGGTYDILRKVTEQDVRDAITRYGLPERASETARNVAERMQMERQEQQVEVVAARNGFRR